MAEKDPKAAGKIPDAILKSAPKLTLEMQGQIGDDVRRSAKEAQFAKDYATSNKARAKNFADKDRTSFVVSKENAREGTKGLASSHFNPKSKEHER